MAEFNFSETEIVGKYSFANEMRRDQELEGEAQDFKKKMLKESISNAFTFNCFFSTEIK